MNVQAGAMVDPLKFQLSLPGEATTIGYSVKDRPIRAWRTGNANQRPILVVAGQHGDEMCAVWAAAKLIRSSSLKPNGTHPAVWTIPCLNPDGVAERKRLNADRVDLNRDHLFRQSPEVRCLHHFIEQVNPSCVLDLHCFPTRRRWMKKLNLEHAADVLIDWESGPAESLVQDPFPLRLASINEWLQTESREQLIAARYWLRSSSGRIRHSTPDWQDLRNQVAARYRIPTLLIEGREPLADEIRQGNRTIEAMFLTVTKIIDEHQNLGVASDGEYFPSLSKSQFMPTQFNYQSKEPIQTHLRDRVSHRPYLLSVGRKHSDSVAHGSYVPVATVIWIPKSLEGIVSHLQRLNAPLLNGAHLQNKSNKRKVVAYRITSRISSRREMRNDRRLQLSHSMLSLDEPSRYYGLIPSLATRIYWTALLDPRHKFSICRMHGQELFGHSDDDYPVLFEYSPNNLKG